MGQRICLAMLFFVAFERPSAADQGLWNAAAGGEWNVPANWLGDVPKSVGDQASFGAFPSADAVISLNAPVTIGTLESSSPFLVTLSSIAPLVDSLTLDTGSSDPATIQLTGAQSRLRIEVPVQLSSAGLITDTVTAASSLRFAQPISGSGQITKVGAGTLQLNANSNAWTGALEILGGVVEANHTSAFGDVAVGTTINGGTLRITQSANENIDLLSGTLIATAPMAGKITVADGLVSLNHAGPFVSSLEMSGGRLQVDQVSTATVVGSMDLANGGTATIAGTGPRTLNLNGGGEGIGNLNFASDASANVNNTGVHYDGRLSVTGAGSLRINAPSSVSEFVLDSKALGEGALRGTSSLQVSDAIVVRKGRIAFESGAQGLTTDVALEKRGLTYANLDNLGTGFNGDVVVEEGEVRAGQMHFGNAAEQTSIRIRERRAAVVLSNGSDPNERWQLDNSTGLAYRGAIRTSHIAHIEGEIHLGDVGSVIGFTQGGVDDELRITGSLTGGALTLVGDGSLNLSSGGHTYTGATILGGSWGAMNTSLNVRDNGALHSTSGIQVNNRARLSISDGAVDRIGDAVPVSLRGGDVMLKEGAETLGAIGVDVGESWIGPELNQEATLTLASLSRSGRGTVAFRNTMNVHLGPTPHVLLTQIPAKISGLIGPWATTDGADFAIYDPVRGVRRLGDTVVRPSSLNGAVSSSHVAVSDPQVLDNSETIASLVSHGFDVDLNGKTLDVATGGIIIATHSDFSRIRNGQLTAGGNSGNGELIVHTVDTLGFNDYAEISANIVDNQTGPVAFTKAGSGRLDLSGQNAYTGLTTLNEGALRLMNAGALPQGGELNVDGGEFLVMYSDESSDTPMELNTVRLRQGGVIRFNVDGIAPALDAQHYLFENGELTLPLAGDGQLLKTTRGHVRLQEDSPEFTGDVVIDDGVLVVDGISAQSAGALEPFGAGLITVNPNGILAHRAFALAANRHEMKANIALNGGDVGVGRVSSQGIWAFRGTMDVLADSQLAAYDADSGEVLQEGGTMVVESDVTLRNGVTLNALGPAQFHLDGLMRVGEDSAMHVAEGTAKLRGVVLSNAPQASLNLVGGSRVAIEASLHVRQNESLSVTLDGALVPLTVSGNGRFAKGNGTLENALKIANGAAVQPGESVGRLTVSNDVEFAAQGSLEWEINSALGTAGGPNGWDLLQVDGSLNVSAMANAPFAIRIAPRLADGTPGLPGDFDPFASYAWTMVEAAGLIGDPSAISLDDALFQAARGGLPLGEFALEVDGTALRILYSAPVCLEGDAWPCNQNIDISDLNAVRNNFGTEGEFGIPGDVYPFDGKVNISDLNAVRNHFGEGAPLAVPEPSTWILASLGGVVLLSRRKVQSLWAPTGID